MGDVKNKNVNMESKIKKNKHIRKEKKGREEITTDK